MIDHFHQGVLFSIHHPQHMGRRKVVPPFHSSHDTPIPGLLTQVTFPLLTCSQALSGLGFKVFTLQLQIRKPGHKRTLGQNSQSSECADAGWAGTAGKAAPAPHPNGSRSACAGTAEPCSLPENTAEPWFTCCRRPSGADGLAPGA
ncbi:hypothetical protein J1605_003502 [Eschrichtius robustus]|uniref:Uncharacterized protein n=1 Tax=Eschrichtius robustus TaxID=9764 RepID=A0AB34HLL4_ESCRO|nr:hypothetical protein J1605_003502 [Eschrichtius robustus]